MASSDSVFDALTDDELLKALRERIAALGLTRDPGSDRQALISVGSIADVCVLVAQIELLVTATTNLLA
jgi:hypothetical protein